MHNKNDIIILNKIANTIRGKTACFFTCQVVIFPGCLPGKFPWKAAYISKTISRWKKQVLNCFGL